MTEAPTSHLPRTPRPPRRRAILHIGAEQMATLLRLPDDVTVAGFTVEPIRDTVVFLLDSERFEPVQECAEPPALFSEVAVEVDDAGAVTQRVTWPELEGAEVATRRDAPADPEEVAARIVEAVITDLSDRSGFDHWWDDIDAGIQDEIRQALERKVQDVLVSKAGMP